jgi:hypothetical protein
MKSRVSMAMGWTCMLGGALAVPGTALADWGENWGVMIWGESLAVPMLGVPALLVLGALLGATATWFLRKRRPGLASFVALVVLAVPLVVMAGPVSIPYGFVNGTVADADEVNANFAAAAAEINDNDARISAAPRNCTLETQAFPTASNYSYFCGPDRLAVGGGGRCPGGILHSYAYEVGSGSGWQLNCATTNAINEIRVWCCDL